MASLKGWRLVVAALGLVAAASGCTPPPKVGDAVGGNVVISNAFSLQLTGASVIPATVGNVSGNKVVVLYTVKQDGVLATTNQIAAAGVAFRFTAASLSVDPVAGGNLMAWRALLRTGTQTLVANPVGGPGTPLALVEANVKQPGSDSTGTVVTLPDGTLSYTFANLLDPSYNPAETMRIGGWLRGAVVATDSASTYDFVPAGGTPKQRDTVVDANCNGCHGLLQAHDGRHGVRLCLTCHTMQNADPDTVDPAAMVAMPIVGTNTIVATNTATNPNPLDLGRMVHRIHRGRTLPTLYIASSNALAPPLPAAAGTNLPLPFLSSRNVPLAGRKFSIVGFQGKEFVFGKVHYRTDNDVWPTASTKPVAEGVLFPRNLRDCGACHGNAPQASEQVNAISRRTCGSCHADIWYGAIAPADVADQVHFAHPGGPQADDTGCRGCHIESVAGSKVYVDTADAHQPLNANPRTNKPWITIVDVKDLQAGKNPTVVFAVTDRMGQLDSLTAPTVAMDNTLPSPSPIPRAMDSVRILISGPTTDYATNNFANGNVAPVQGTVALANTLAIAGTNLYSYTFTAAMPNVVSGTWAVGMEARRAMKGTIAHYDQPTDSFRWPYTGENVSETADNPVVFVDTGVGSLWGGTPVARRTIVTDDKCARCHTTIDFHGGSRHDPKYCVLCHAPDRTDYARRPNVKGTIALGNTYDNLEERSIHFKVMIHRIHTGGRTGLANLEAIQPFLVYGNGNAAFFYDEGIFPGALSDCTLCHEGPSYRIESVPETAAATLANETSTIRHKATSVHQAGEPATLPITAACTACHATSHAIAHAATYTSGGAEQCVSCHGGTTGALSVDKAHGL